MPELVRLTDLGNGAAALSWPSWTTAEELARTVSAVTGRALAAGARRVEASVPAEDRATRGVLLRLGFRVEGVRRQAGRRDDGGWGDLVLFARLADDAVGGPSGFSGVMNSALPRTRVIAHVLFRDADGRALLCNTWFKVDWELPGGVVEAREAPRAGALRELAEELGIALPVGRLLVVDWLPPYLGWDDAVELIFDGGLLTAEQVAGFTLQPTEIRGVRFCTLEEAAVLLTPLAHRRLTVATSLGFGRTAYLEDGVEVLPEA